MGPISHNRLQDARHIVRDPGARCAGGVTMSDKVYDVPAEWKTRAWLDEAKYKDMYAASTADPNTFWGEQAKRISWMRPFTKVKNTSFEPGKVSIKWFE